MPTYCNVADSFSTTCGEAITAGDAVSLHGDGLVYRANAAVGANQDIPAIGIAETTEILGGELEVKRRGHVAEATGLTAGAWVYLGESDGAVTATAPSSAGDAVQVVGIALSQTEYAIDLQPETIV